MTKKGLYEISVQVGEFTIRGIYDEENKRPRDCRVYISAEYNYASSAFVETLRGFVHEYTGDSGLLKLRDAINQFLEETGHA